MTGMIESLEFRRVNSKLLGDFARFPPVKKNGRGISGRIGEAALLADRLGQRNSPCVELVLSLITRSAKREERLRLREEINHVVWKNVDIIGRFIDQCAEGHARPMSFAFERDPSVITFGCSARQRG